MLSIVTLVLSSSCNSLKMTVATNKMYQDTKQDSKAHMGRELTAVLTMQCNELTAVLTMRCNELTAVLTMQCNANMNTCNAH